MHPKLVKKDGENQWLGTEINFKNIKMNQEEHRMIRQLPKYQYCVEYIILVVIRVRLQFLLLSAQLWQMTEMSYALKRYWAVHETQLYKGNHEAVDLIMSKLLAQ